MNLEVREVISVVHELFGNTSHVQSIQLHVFYLGPCVKKYEVGVGVFIWDLAANDQHVWILSANLYM